MPLKVTMVARIKGILGPVEVEYRPALSRVTVSGALDMRYKENKEYISKLGRKGRVCSQSNKTLKVHTVICYFILDDK